jgi:hypothetical protein
MLSSRNSKKKQKFAPFSKKKYIIAVAFAIETTLSQHTQN